MIRLGYLEGHPPPRVVVHPTDCRPCGVVHCHRPSSHHKKYACLHEFGSLYKYYITSKLASNIFAISKQKFWKFSIVILVFAYKILMARTIIWLYNTIKSCIKHIIQPHSPFHGWELKSQQNNPLFFQVSTPLIFSYLALICSLSTDNFTQRPLCTFVCQSGSSFIYLNVYMILTKSAYCDLG